MSLHVPFCVWHMRRSVIREQLAGHQCHSFCGWCCVGCCVCELLLKELWRRSEVRGEAVRLDRPIEADEPNKPSRFGCWLLLSRCRISICNTWALERKIPRQASGFNNAGSIQVCFEGSKVAQKHMELVKVERALAGVLALLDLRRPCLGPWPFFASRRKESC